MQPLPLKIKQLREMLGMSQDEFARKIGVKQQNINYNEQERTASGKERTVSIDLIDKICSSFGIEKYLFLNGSAEEILNSTKNFSSQLKEPQKHAYQNTELTSERKYTLEDYIELRVKLAQAEQLAKDMLAQNNIVLAQNNELVKILDNRLNSADNIKKDKHKDGDSRAVKDGSG